MLVPCTVYSLPASNNGTGAPRNSLQVQYKCCRLPGQASRRWSERFWIPYTRYNGWVEDPDSCSGKLPNVFYLGVPSLLWFKMALYLKV